MDHSTIPPCEATGPDGALVLIHPHAVTDSVADLARAFDLPVTTTLAIDDCVVAPHERLVTTGLRVGSTVTVATPALCAPPSGVSPTADHGATAAVAVAVAVGPACTRWVVLPPGRHTVGRATSAEVRVDDPTVELHHGVFDVGADGSVAFTQLTGVFPASVDGVPCGRAHPIEPDGVLAIGTSRLVFSRPHLPTGVSEIAGSVVRADHDPWRSIVRRGPFVETVDTPDALAVPEPPAPHRSPPLTALVGAGIAAVVAGLLAVVLGQVLFAVFAAVGAVASLATWAVGALVARRDRQHAESEHQSALAQFEHALGCAHDTADRSHRVRHRSVVDALDTIQGGASGVWAQRCGRSEALWVTIGRGTCRWKPPITADDRCRLNAGLLLALDRCERLEDVAVPLAIESSSVVAFRGAPALGAALCRAVIVQLGAHYGPADWELQVVTNEPERWSWIRWLPQTRHRPCLVDAADSVALAEAMERANTDVDLDCDPNRDPQLGSNSGPGPDSDRRRRTVIIIDAPELLVARTGPVRRRLDRGDVSCITLVAPEASVPSVVDRILELGDTGSARWIDAQAPAWTALDREVVIAGVSLPTAEAAARRLASLLDPEDLDRNTATPSTVSLAQLEPLDDHTATTIARRWKSAGRDPAPLARLGLSADGIVDIDLARDGPHGLIAGTTGSGKSELLRTLVVSLAAQVGPDHITMILVDYKGGSTFDACARLPHTVGVVTDLDDGLAERVLVSLDAEVRRRERLLRAAGVDDLAAYRRAIPDPLPRLVVVIDEFASLAKELPDFLGTLVAIAQRGRSLGIHLLLATQRPAGVVTDDIRANTNLRIALRLQDRTDAEDVVGDPAPARFAPVVPGRAALRLGPDELVVFQTASSAGGVPTRAGRLRVEPAGEVAEVDPGPSVLARLVDAISHAAAMVGSASPHRPWIDALPRVIRPHDLEQCTAVGVLDDPGGQCRRALTWAPALGSLLLVGAVGAGTTTAAVTVAAMCARTASPGSLHLYVVDAQGDPAWSGFEAVAHCGAVVRIGELERLTRLFARLADELDHRSTGATREPSIVVVIDGLAAVRGALGDVAHSETIGRLDRVLRDGPAVGMVSVVTTDGVSPAGIAVPRAATWVFHVGDQGIARTVGLRAPAVIAGVPGRMRVVESGLEGQIVLDPEPLRRMDPSGPCDERPDDPGTLTGRHASGAPRPVLVLPEVVDADELEARCVVRPQRGGPVELLVGVGADDLEPAVLRVPIDDHVFIGGSARTGRSTALRQVEAAWRRMHPGSPVLHVERGRPVAGVDAVVGEVPLLIVVDDAERVDDPDGALARLLARPEVTFAIAARLEAVRVAYGHWTREVARSRCGLIMTSMGDVDGELLGATLPRRPWIAPRAGLAWTVDQRGHRLVQVAARMPP